MEIEYFFCKIFRATKIYFGKTHAQSCKRVTKELKTLEQELHLRYVVIFGGSHILNSCPNPNPSLRDQTN